MDTIGLVELSFRRQGSAGLARFTLPKNEREARLPGLRDELGVTELVYVATCNRVNVLFRVDGIAAERDLRRHVFRALAGVEPAPGEAERTLRGWYGEGAVEQLFLVACGLESAQLGEREVQGQLREALTMAREAGTAGLLVDRLIEEALRVAHQVHRETRLGSGRTSLAEIAADHLLERVRRTPSPVALIGVSPMTERAAEALRREHVEVILVNRSLDHARELAAKLGGATVLSLDEFRSRPPAIEALLTATGSPEAVLDRAALERLAARAPSGEPPLVVDLAVPPDVRPEVARAAGLTRIDMDEINRLADLQRKQREAEVAAARERVDKALSELRRRLAERLLAPVLASLGQRYRRTALEGLERLLTKEKLELDSATKETIERWAETLARRFAHLPTVGLRGLASEEGLQAVRSFLAAGDEELSRQLGDQSDELGRWAEEAVEKA